MTNEELNLKIKSAFKNITPDNFQKILSESKQQKGSVVSMTTNNNRIFKKFAAVAAAFIILALGISLISVNYFGNQLVSSVSLDVNPSVNIQLDRNEKVIDVIPFNEDGEKIIGTMDFKGSDLTVTINALVGSMLRNGFLSDIQNSVLVTVEGENHDKNEQIRKRVEDEISAVLNGGNFEAAIVKQEINDEDDALEDFAKKHNISEGKAKLVHEIAKELPHHTPEELAKLSINELNILVENTVKIETQGEASKKKYIDTDKAWEIALNKAAVNKNEIYDTSAKMESDDGIIVYDIDFSANNIEYEVEINATTGAIINFDKESVDDDFTVTVKPSVENQENASAKNIGEDEAKSIALKKAGVSASTIKNYVCKSDTDDGVKVYEIEFTAGNYEYDIEINAQNGKIRDLDKEHIDRDDDDKSTSKPKETKPASDSDNYIGKAKAKSVALKKAGVSADNIKAYSCEFDNDDGKAVYEIEFKSGKYEYSVEINAKTGAITDYEKEVDD